MRQGRDIHGNEIIAMPTTISAMTRSIRLYTQQQSIGIAESDAHGGRRPPPPHEGHVGVHVFNAPLEIHSQIF